MPFTPNEEQIQKIKSSYSGVNAKQLNQLVLYLRLLLETNKSLNLTAVTEAETAWDKHIAESVALAAQLAQTGGMTNVIDVGSGGGLPGIPLAICLPDMHVTLLEATAKKVRFLAHCVEFLGLTNCRVEQARAECAGQHAEWREHFSGAVCRAVGTLAEILELATPFLKVGGCFFAIKGARSTEEVTAAQRAAKELNLIIKAAVPLFPLSPTDSVIIQCEKNDHTPAMYPRRDGMPKKRPL